jgi:hypothetical protein
VQRIGLGYAMKIRALLIHALRQMRYTVWVRSNVYR